MSLVPAATIFDMFPEDIFKMVSEISLVKRITLSRAILEHHAAGALLRMELV